MKGLKNIPNVDNGFIYILKNPSMPNIYKVGYTTNNIYQRLKELNTTGVPNKFIISSLFVVNKNEVIILQKFFYLMSC